MKYKIITVNTVQFIGTNFEKAAEELTELVNAALREGWKPIGGVAVGGTQSTHEPHLFQAMVAD